MKNINLSLITFLLGFVGLIVVEEIYAQPTFELSKNVYRAPYDNGIEFRVSRDHYQHTPAGRYDLIARGDDDCNSHNVVAAAAGIVQIVVDTNTTSCSSGCGGFNNYVWIKHANGEWTKYTHMAPNSVPVVAGDIVQAGDNLGLECWVGNTSPAFGRHLHFEVRQPFDTTNVMIDTSGGFMSSADHVIPVLCGTNGQYVMNDEEFITANDCVTCMHTGDITVDNINLGFDQQYARTTNGVITASAITFNNGAGSLLQSEKRIIVTPGFQAKPGSVVELRTRNCGTTPLEE